MVYHLGNSISVQLEGSIVRYARDHVIDGMVRHLGFEPVPVDMPFQPIDGAYKHHHHHSHESWVAEISEQRATNRKLRAFARLERAHHDGVVIDK